MAKTQFTVEQFKTEAVKPLYAVAGATELAVELARGYATEAQTRVSKVELEPKSIQAQARTRVEELQKEAKDAQARFEARVTELQKEAKEFPAKFESVLNEALDELNTTYADLQVRGEKFVRAIRKDGVRAVANIKPIATKRVTNPATRTTTAKQTAAKKTTTKKATKKAS
jgi:DNA repair ATPase RecN